MADQIISTWDKSPLRGATFTADEVNSPDFGIPGFVRKRSDELAAQREQYARRLLEERLPKRLRWTIDRPRALKLVLRLVPRWRPRFTVVRLERPPHPLDHLRGMPVMTANAADAMARTWIREMRAKGNSVPESGLIFAYADPSGLPAEVHGVG